LVGSMTDQGLYPDGEIYRSLLLALAENYKVDIALQILNEMTVRGFEPNLIGYRSLICALCKLDRREEASNLFESMLLQQWSPDEIVWTILIDGLVMEGEPDLCMKFLHAMEARDHAPTYQTYIILARQFPKDEKYVNTSLLVSKLMV